MKESFCLKVAIARKILRSVPNIRDHEVAHVYGIPTSPSASVMAQNIQLFGPRECFLTHQWIITGNK